MRITWRRSNEWETGLNELYLEPPRSFLTLLFWNSTWINVLRKSSEPIVHDTTDINKGELCWEKKWKKSTPQQSKNVQLKIILLSQTTAIKARHKQRILSSQIQIKTSTSIPASIKWWITIGNWLFNEAKARARIWTSVRFSWRIWHEN